MTAKNDVIRFRVDEYERAQIQTLADKFANGNISRYIKDLLWQEHQKELAAGIVTETRFEIKMGTAEVRTRLEIVHGCASDDPDPTLIAAFRTKDEALAALRTFRSTARHLDGWTYPFFFVTDYWCEENVYRIDEDGDADFFEGGDVWAYAEWDKDYQEEEEEEE